MKNFREFLNEIYTLSSIRKGAFVDDDIDDDPSHTKVSTFFNHEGEPHDVYHQQVDNDNSTYNFTKKGDKKVQLAIHGSDIIRNDRYARNKKVGMQIHAVGSIPKSSVRASDAYKHLVLYHGLSLVSDMSQTKKGQSIWNRLGDEHVNSLKKGVEPDIQTHILTPKGNNQYVPTTRSNYVKYTNATGKDYDPNRAGTRLVLTKNPNKTTKY